MMNFTQLMGGETAEINIDARPAVILMSGFAKVRVRPPSPVSWHGC